MIKTSLNGSWSMNKEGDNHIYDAVIPGSVLSTLLASNAIPDPYDRMNEYEVRDILYDAYTFSRTFDVSEEMLKEDYTDLVCYGLDTLATICINGQEVARTNNMHRTYSFPVRELLNIGENKVQITFASPIEYVENYECEKGREIGCIPSGGTKGNQYLRKTHSMFGWDWGAQLPDEGIWRDIELHSYSDAKISDVRIHQHHDNGAVTLEVKVSLDVYASQKYKVSLGLAPSYFNGAKLPRVELQALTGLVMEGQKEITMSIPVKEPRLWWPNGIGDQNLYDLTVSLKKAGVIAGGAAAQEILKAAPLDERTYTLGLRTLEVCQDSDEWGQEFCFRVNGQKIFAMGANYIPEDCIYSRITRERIDYLTESAKRANYNMLRVWGGGYYPSDDFYDLCDKKGLLVWQDCMFACNGYDLTREMEETLVPEIKDNVRRLRHHASLALWCGNNEVESAWIDWPEFEDGSPYIRADYVKIFEYLIPKAIREEDDETFYWPSSPSSGGCFDDPCDPNRGDMHYWAVWHGQKPFTDYQKHIFRFCSEFGFQSFPCLKTVETFARKEDQNIFSDVMESHQKNTSANGKMLYYVSENFRYPKDFESLLYVTQILQAIAVKSGVEHWRRYRGRCMGTLYWQINDNWPVASWASMDYFGRWKPLHYLARNFYAPVAGSIYKTGEKENSFTGMKAYVQNESGKVATVTLTLTLRRMDFTEVETMQVTKEIGPFSVLEMASADYKELLIPEDNACLRPSIRKEMQGRLSKKDVFVEAVFEIQTEDGVRRQIEAETFLPYKHMHLPEPVLEKEVTEDEKHYTITLKSNAYAPFTLLDFADADVILSDNCLTFTSIEERILVLDKKDILQGSFASAQDLKERLKITTLRDTY